MKTIYFVLHYCVFVFLNDVAIVGWFGHIFYCVLIMVTVQSEIPSTRWNNDLRRIFSKHWSIYPVWALKGEVDKDFLSLLAGTRFALFRKLSKPFFRDSLSLIKREISASEISNFSVVFSQGLYIIREKNLLNHDKRKRTLSICKNFPITREISWWTVFL